MPGEGTSDVWLNFARGIVDGVFCCHMSCNTCKAILKWKAKDGTSGLKAHLQSCKGDKFGAGGLWKLTDLAGVSTLPAVRHITAADKHDVTEAVVQFSAKDICPFNTVEGKF